MRRLKRDFIRLTGDDTLEKVVRPKIHAYGEKAKTLLDKLGADHVVYCENCYDENGIKTVALFLLPLSNKQFNKLYKHGHIDLSRTVYVVHAPPKQAKHSHNRKG